ncbi:helix-turn-helix domain-containing protein [Fluviispira multicolorata]|uniref:Helix-turn-helix domain-containing protein n=1 Tax=Fluviispira multicolorata TaxID=2654512 RepID=A0A833JBG9_9BACT|nr:helix-turn-helix domain-containing protein [Fluviispira multicolorata]KAB8029209.1 helix-turn-helix domain-containing protein [Fluviispira multicolorata]
MRTEVISDLAQQKSVPWSLANFAAKKLNISRRQVYTLINGYRQDEGLVTEMLVKKSHGGKGKSLLPEAIDQIIQDVLKSHYLNKQKYSDTVVWNEIDQRCLKQNLTVG